LENLRVNEPLILRARAAAELDVVRRALTDPAELREWFAESVDVELPKRFAFWGRYTPEGDAPHQRLLHVDDRSLRFVWRLDGIDTTSEIRLAPQSADSTIVTISQTHFDFQEALEERTSCGMLQTFWTLALANLADHVEGRPITYRCDFTSPRMRAEITINAPREVIYDALTDSNKASAWMGFPVGIEPRVGGRFVMGGFESPVGYAATIVEFEPGRKMAVDWDDNGIATWELADSGGKTRLTFIQSGFTTPRAPYAGWMGTLAGIASLRRFVESDPWRPIYMAAA
jgi:uncharacterized protein YndB with AHSA1/START domain